MLSIDYAFFQITNSFHYCLGLLFYYTINEVSDLEYYIGLSGYSFWKRVSGYYIQSSFSLNGLLCVIECRLEDKHMLVKSGQYPGSDWIDLDLS